MKNTTLKKISAVILGLLLPKIALAQTFKSAVASVVNTVGSYLMPLLFSTALAWFIWGVVDFIRSADNSEERKKGKQRILWGIIALFAMVGYLGLTAVFTNTFFGSGPALPQLFTQ